MNPAALRLHMGNSSAVMTARYAGEIPLETGKGSVFQHAIEKYEKWPV